MVKHNSRIKIDVCKVTYMVFGAVKMQIMSILWVKSQFFRQNDIIEAQIESKVFNLWVLPTKWSTIFLKLFASSWQQKIILVTLQICTPFHSFILFQTSLDINEFRYNNMESSMYF